MSPHCPHKWARRVKKLKDIRGLHKVWWVSRSPSQLPSDDGTTLDRRGAGERTVKPCGE